jgi:gamma-glutamylputrescine oxidase
VLFEAQRVVWGAFGRAAIQLTYWSYQAADAAREFRSR